MLSLFLLFSRDLHRGRREIRKREKGKGKEKGKGTNFGATQEDGCAGAVMSELGEPFSTSVFKGSRGNNTKRESEGEREGKEERKKDLKTCSKSKKHLFGGKKGV